LISHFDNSPMEYYISDSSIKKEGVGRYQ